MRSSRLASIDRTLVKTERPWRTSQISVDHAPLALFCGCCSRIKVFDAVHAGDAGYVVTAEDAAKLVQTVLGPDGPNETRDRLALRGRAFRGAAWGLGAALGRHHRRQSCALVQRSCV